MFALYHGNRTPLVVGADQRSSTLATRDRLHVDDEGHARLLTALRREGVDQALVICTCDRVEVHAMHATPQEAGRRIAEVLARHGGFAPDEIEDQLYVLTGSEALRHVFAVAASLESTIVGEPQVLGQIKDCHRLSREAGFCGTELDAAMQRAFAAAKRVRNETAIGAGPVSVSAAAVGIAEAVHGDLSAASGLMIGSGEVGELLAGSLRAAGLGRLRVTDPRPARAEAAARLLGCEPLDVRELPSAGAAADVTIACLGATTPVVDVETATAMMRGREGRPMVLLDMGLPGDVDPRVDGLDGAFLYSLDDLERMARQARRARTGEVDAARRIVDEEVAAFVRKRAERAAVPVFARLREHFEAERARAVTDAGGDAEKATRLLMNRLLHSPIRRLRDMAGAGDDGATELARLEEMLDRLFEPVENEASRRR